MLSNESEKIVIKLSEIASILSTNIVSNVKVTAVFYSNVRQAERITAGRCFSFFLG